MKHLMIIFTMILNLDGVKDQLLLTLHIGLIRKKIKIEDNKEVHMMGVALISNVLFFLSIC
jgi:hypothetical protein